MMAKKLAESQRREILCGDYFKTILVICMPLAIYNLFNSFYGLIDQTVCSGINIASVNAVASLSQIKNLISSFGAGLAGGGAILVARHYGKGDLKEARKTSSVLLLLALVVSLIIMFICIPFAVQIMQLARVDNVAIEIGKNYFRLQLVELVFVSLNSVFIGLEKAKGNSKIIFVLNISVLLIKLALTCLFVYVFKVDNIAWVEVATIIGQLSLFIVGITTLFSKKNVLHVSISQFSLSWKYVKPILLLSIPIFLGKFVMSLGKVTVNAMCGMYYDVATQGLIVGALNVSNTLSGLVTSPMNAFEEGESTIVSQNLGNKNMKRTLKYFIRVFTLSTVMSLIGYVLVRFIFLDNLITMFSSDDNQSEYFMQLIKEIFKYDSLSIISLGINASVLGMLYGYGQTFLSTILNGSRIGTRILTLFLLHKYKPDLGPQTAGISMGISNIVIGVLSLLFLAIFLVYTFKKGYKGMRFSDPEPEMVVVDGILVRKDLAINQKDNICTE